ncbi:hypothetical protein BDN72DRAFT_847229 [Pluteus cervinus]|uniref:Uncharacterized protein n=1 Tax=Pluteus cervinus TaxID=181527 RepID=A0ACD3AD61_9AGAR|nr:hypothetical protein BDN72DRAFT_847229 [Pluteus cervinus]
MSETPAPCLVEIHLHRISLPGNLFSGTCPSLQSLTLTSCEVAWSAIPVSSSLTKLSIHTPSQRFSVDDVIAKMRIIGPTLRELRLEFVLRPATGTHSTSGPFQPQIPFKNMTSFKLDDNDARPVCLFLDQVSLRDCPNITVAVSEGTLEEQFAIAQALVASRGLPTWPVTNIEVDLHESCLTLLMTEAEKRSISLGLSFPGDSQLAAVLSAFSTLPLAPVKTIRFSGGYFEDHDPAPFHYFNARGTIQHLELAAEFIPTFIRFIQPQNTRLREIADVVGVDDRNKLVLDHQTAGLGLNIIGFPGLQKIRIDGDDFDEMEPGYGAYLTLREWLVWRNIFGVRLGSLVLVNLNVPCGTIDWFEDLVDKFEQIDVEEVDQDDD